MKSRFLILFLFSFMNMHAQTIEKIIKTIGNDTKSILSLAKRSLEEPASTNSTCAFLGLTLPEEEIVLEEQCTTYIDKTTSTDLSKKLDTDANNQAYILLRDFIKTNTYKKLKNNLQQFINEISTCSFLTTKESQALRSINVFYPDTYPANAYAWELNTTNNNINFLQGRIYKNMCLTNSLIKSCELFIDIDIKYICHVKTIINKPAMFEGSTIKNLGPEVNFYAAPHDEIIVSINFWRKKEPSFDCDTYVRYATAAKYTCSAHGQERVTSLVNSPSPQLNKGYEAYEMKIDFENSGTPPFISSSLTVEKYPDTKIFPPSHENYLDAIIKEDFSADLEKFYTSRYQDLKSPLPTNR